MFASLSAFFRPEEGPEVGLDTLLDRVGGKLLLFVQVIDILCQEFGFRCENPVAAV